MTDLRLAYTSIYDAQDVRNWSGSGHYIARSMEASGAALDYVGPLEEKAWWRSRAVQAACRFFTRRRHMRDRDPRVLDGYARQVESRLRHLSVQAVFGPGTLPLAHLETDLPIAFWADATFAGLTQLYPAYGELCPTSKAWGDGMERKVLERCAIAFYASDWAAETAIRHHGADPKKVHVVPFGANMDVTRTDTAVAEMIAARSRDTLRLLFVGVEWHRKGGDTALAVARELHQAGVPVELTIVGCAPEVVGPLPPFVRPLGFISKATPEGRARLDDLYAESHFLIVPSRAECFGVVFCEASSFGVPSLAMRVGGIPTAVREGANGLLFDLEDEPAAMARRIEAAWREGYGDLARSSFEEYARRLNWSTSGREVMRLLRAHLPC